ncbi:ribosomal L7Ae/L30e/S12e/Gadd45 family protein [Paenibacillus sp. IB182496]|uniref:Ribosomal L7Ae/L30e/S12e/Gadd45 family protein n=1 Tax=Paenibacillus sabuli TaxID=2772509 RepID=A0A927BTI4_9BACL|nr:ribosomal L7Ae/L30e/S12e/Gadd45 family protein [Paenibacillus sabuli]MBD2845244.1 ribosomal L7Ae/L30e/S12e/Gadd45 family protein [Paenibacillus sabuli]
MNHKVLSNLGMAMRAGKLATGEEIVHRCIRDGKAKLVLIATDTAPGTRKKVLDKCATYGVDYAVALDRVSIGQAIGKAERVLVAVTDQGFAAMIQKQLSQLPEVENID